MTQASPSQTAFIGGVYAKYPTTRVSSSRAIYSPLSFDFCPHNVAMSGGTAMPSWKARLFREDSRPTEVCVPSARTHCSAALTAGSLGVNSLVSFGGASEGRYRPDLKCFGPCKASHVARRAASSMFSSLRSPLGIFVVVDKTESSFITEPMIPLVYKWFVDVLEKNQASFKPPPYISFQNVVSASGDARDDSLNCIVRRRELYEMKRRVITKTAPRLQPLDIRSR